MPSPNAAKMPAGTFAVPDTQASVTRLTEGQSLHSEEYGLRMSVFNEERRARGVRTPCQDDPQTWDAIDLEYSYEYGRLRVKRVEMDREVARISQAVAFCTYCPMLEECRPLAEVATTTTEHGTTIVDAEGVIGGELIDSTISGRVVLEYVKTGEWPGGVVWSRGD